MWQCRSGRRCRHRAFRRRGPQSPPAHLIRQPSCVARPVVLFRACVWWRLARLPACLALKPSRSVCADGVMARGTARPRRRASASDCGAEWASRHRSAATADLHTTMITCARVPRCPDVHVHLGTALLLCTRGTRLLSASVCVRCIKRSFRCRLSNEGAKLCARPCLGCLVF